MRAPDTRAVDAALAGLWIVAVAAIGLVIAANLLSLDVAGHALRDSDGYMRVVRVHELLAGAVGWFESWAPRGNAPFGHAMHWTRPMDIALLALVLPLRTVLDRADALYVAAVAIGPVLHVLFAGAVYWAARSLVGRGAAILAALLAAVQPMIVSYAAAGRADHHVLILLVATLTAGAGIRLLLADDATAARAAAHAGILAAAGIWVSTESLLPFAALALTLAGSWAVRGGDVARHVGFWISFTIALAAALVLERGPADLFAIEYDRISLPYLALGVLGSGAWLLIRRSAGESASLRRRVLATAAFGAAAAIMLVLLFPGMLHGPFADVPPELRARWLSRVVELRPLSRATLNAYDLAQLLLPVAGLAAIWPAMRAANAHARAAWSLVLVLIVLGLGATVTGTRLAFYPQTFAAIPVAFATGRLLARLQRAPLPLQVLSRVALSLLVAFAWIPVTWLPLHGAGGPVTERCDVAAAAAALDRTTIERPVILAGNGYGPEFLYRLDASVVSTPYHRNVEGILDALDAFHAEPTAAAAILERRSVDIVAVCPADAVGEYAGADSASFHRRLLTRRPPAYASLIAEPAATGRFLLYRVTTGPGHRARARAGN